MAMHYQPGGYFATVVDQAWQDTRNGDPMLVLRVKPTSEIGIDESGGECRYALQVVDYERTVRIPFVQSSAKSMEMGLQKLRFGCGWDGGDFNELDLQGSEIRVRCAQGEYQGQPKEDWDIQLPAYSSEPLKSTSSDAPRKLNALFGRKLKEEAPEDVGPPPPPVEAYESGPLPEDDDIPF